MILCHMACCLKICKSCKHYNACKVRGVCSDICETTKGLICKRYIKIIKKSK